METDTTKKEQGLNFISGGNLQVGSSGEQVKQLQTMLGITADGVFGQQTQAAVKKYQTDNSLTSDGIVGSNTNAALTKLPPPTPPSGVTTPESLTPGTKIVVPPITPGTDNATSFVTGIQAAQDASIKAAEDIQNKTQGEYDTMSKSISDLLGTSGGQGQATIDAEKEAGIAEKQAAVDEVSSRVKTGLAEYNALKAEFDKQSSDIEAGAGRKGLTTGAVSGQQGAIERAKLARLNSKASEIGMLQAEESALQGKLNSAKEMADRAVELKYSDKKTELGIKIEQLKLLGNTLTAKEKITADLLEKQYKAQTLSLSTKIANDKDMNATLLNQMQTYPDAGITLKDTVESANNKITTRSKIYADKIRQPVGSTANTGKSYTVSPGDVPQFIANKSGLTLETLLALNPGVNWNNLQKGQKLNIDTSDLSSVKPADTIGLTSAKIFELQQLGVDIEAYKSDTEYRTAVNSNLPN